METAWFCEAKPGAESSHLMGAAVACTDRHSLAFAFTEMSGIGGAGLVDGERPPFPIRFS